MPKNDSTCFCQNFAKSAPNLIMFSTQIARTIELCKIHSLSTSRNLCQRTTVQNADAPNCCVMLSCCLCKSSDDLIKKNNKQKCDLFSKIISLCNNLQNLCPKCIQWLRHDATADSSINDQLIKMHSTHSWIKCV